MFDAEYIITRLKTKMSGMKVNDSYFLSFIACIEMYTFYVYTII